MRGGGKHSGYVCPDHHPTSMNKQYEAQSFFIHSYYELSGSLYGSLPNASQP
jgi:hypothetical protein